MEHRLLYAGGFVLALVALSTSRADAQTVAPGPYYATPSWDQTLACSTAASCPRFIVLSNMDSNAVLDRETGLVWQRRPSASAFPFDSMVGACAGESFGGFRKGWRLPSLHELMSLIDTSVLNQLALPAGHPFLVDGVDQNTIFWTGTSVAVDPSQAYVTEINSAAGTVGDAKTNSHARWCVRGGGPIGVY